VIFKFPLSQKERRINEKETKKEYIKQIHCHTKEDLNSKMILENLVEDSNFFKDSIINAFVFISDNSRHSIFCFPF